MSMAILKILAAGKEFHLKSPAVCQYSFERIQDEVDPKVFNPLIIITGGASIISFGAGDQAGNGLMFGGDWIYLCRDLGASTRNAVISLAANFDTKPGMVALALELAMFASKPGTDETIRLDIEDFAKIIDTLYGNNWGGIYDQMKGVWGVEVKPDAVFSPAMTETRSRVAEAHGHDVLIHPVDLQPCRDADGVFEYLGLVQEGDDAFFSFRRKNGEVFRTETFPPVLAH